MSYITLSDLPTVSHTVLIRRSSQYAVAAVAWKAGNGCCGLFFLRPLEKSICLPITKPVSFLLAPAANKKVRYRTAKAA